MKKRIRPILTVLILAIVVGIISINVSRARHKPPPPPRTVAAHIGDITIRVSETGAIEPINKIDVKSKVAGRLLAIPIQEGQYVQKGQLIAVVDRTLIAPQIARQQAQLSQAQAALRQAIAEYDLQRQQTIVAKEQAQAGMRTAQMHLAAVAAGSRPQELAQQRQAVERAQIALADAQRTQKRRQSLLEKGYISQSDADTSQVAVDTAASNLASAQQQLALTEAGPRPQDVADARTQVDAARVQIAGAEANALQNNVRRTAIDQARAAVAQNSNDLAQLMVSLNDTQIVAPASGIVLKKYKEPTEIVQSATTGFSDQQSIVATLGDKLMVRVGINEVDIPKVHLGAPVAVHIDALPDTVFTGKVQEIAPASSNAFTDSGASTSSSGQNTISKFPVKVTFDRYDLRLRPGMTAGVDIISTRHSHVVLVALEAIPFTGSHGTVTVFTPSKQKQPRTVTLGLRNDTEVEVLSGLHAGDAVVVAPINGKGRRTIDINGGP